MKLLGIDSELRIFQNLFLPSMKLLDKTRIGSKLKRRYDKAKTTLDRLLNCTGRPLKIQELKNRRDSIDLFAVAKGME